ncbi:MAG TPA: DNA repair protein RecN [Bacillota bacterium]
MLVELAIEDFALIDAVRLTFSPGLNVLTGETGAGKSILVDAMTVLLGGRASEDYIRSGSERARVTGLFQLDDRARDVIEQLAAAGYDAGDELVLDREISRHGRNISRINGRPASVTMIRQLAERLVGLHGQHEQQALLRPSRHRELLDAFGGDAVAQARATVERLYEQWLAVRRELEQLVGDHRERARAIDLLRFQIGEIDAAALQPDEDEQLRALRNRLAHADRLREALGRAYALLYAGEAPAYDRVGQAQRELERVLTLDPELGGALDLLASAAAHLDEAARMLRDRLEAVDDDPDLVERVEARWRLLGELRRKYGDTVADILAYRAQAARELDRLESSSQRALELQRRQLELLQELAGAALRLTELREQAAERLAVAVAHELADLGMPARLVVIVDQRQEAGGVLHRGREVAFGPAGVDQVELLITTNPGEPPRPLQRVASGGELSRIMLALQSVLGRRDRLPVVIFDEIDAGIGGRTANAVADKLAAIAADRQVLCVTHLAQVAALADRHFVIEKHVENGRTVTRVQTLAAEGREREIARMLAGEQGDVDLAHARALLARARGRRAG